MSNPDQPECCTPPPRPYLRILFATVAALLTLGGCSVLPTRTSPVLTGIPTTPPTTQPQPVPAPVLHAPFLAKPAAPLATVGHWMAWAAMDTVTGEVIASDNATETNAVMSMMKAWIAADWLYTHPEPEAGLLAAFSTMIRDSANWPARTYWDRMGGNKTMARMHVRCEVQHAKVLPWAWSLTELSPVDTVRLGACLRDGRAAGEWTGWLLSEMRQVRGQGDFGIRLAFPELHDSIAIKNGWADYLGTWYVNCLAIGSDWVMAVMQRGGSLQANAHVCQRVAETLHNAALTAP